MASAVPKKSAGKRAQTEPVAVCEVTKQELGERVFVEAQKLCPEDAQIVTGMILEMEIPDIVALLENTKNLVARIEEATHIVWQRRDAQAKQQQQQQQPAWADVVAGTEEEQELKWIRVDAKQREELLKLNITQVAFPLLLRGVDPLATQQRYWAIRASERFGDMKALFRGERTFVRFLILRSQATIVIESAGKTPLIVLHGIGSDIVKVPYLQRSQWVKTQVASNNMLDIPELTGMTDISRHLILRKDLDKFPRARLVREAGAHAVIETVEEGPASLAHMKLSTLLHTDPQCENAMATIVLTKETPIGRIAQIAAEIQKLPTIDSVYLNHWSIRVKAKQKIDASVLNSISISREIRDIKCDIFIDQHKSLQPRTEANSTTQLAVLKAAQAPVLSAGIVQAILHRIDGQHLPSKFANDKCNSALVRIPKSVPLPMVISGGLFVIEEIDRPLTDENAPATAAPPAAPSIGTPPPLLQA